ncbi:MAG: 50S ribosomal protein L30 [Deltaproteobacteria bacterium]|jgi:large subunit ribosomal protein L30|nr:50S ribosomal protein L30 [Deltaproteobacteria bacterium]
MDKEIKTAQVKITQIKSTIGRLPVHRATVRALGLRRIGHSVVKNHTPAVQGMIRQVCYLLKVEEVPE